MLRCALTDLDKRRRRDGTGSTEVFSFRKHSAIFRPLDFMVMCTSF